MEAAEHRKRAARLEGFPDLDLGVGYRIREHVSGDPVKGDDFVGASITVRLPVDRRRWRAEVAERDAQVRHREAYSPELVSTQEELLQAARYRDTTAASSFEDVVEGGAALFRASKRRLELWDIPERDIRRLLETGTVRKNLTLYAPGPGVVVDLMAREGMAADPNMRLYGIADLSEIWIYADVYEYEMPWIEVGQRGVAEPSHRPEERFVGAVAYIYPCLDPKTRTARVRLEFPNPDRVLKPDMFANVTIDTRTQEDVLAVPSEAILRSGQRTLAIVALGDGRFEPRTVALGIDGGEGLVEVTEGLRAGERVVTSGQFLIDSESRLREAVQKLSATDDEAPMPEMEGHDTSDMEESPEGHDMPGRRATTCPAWRATTTRPMRRSRRC